LRDHHHLLKTPLFRRSTTGQDDIPSKAKWKVGLARMRLCVECISSYSFSAVCNGNTHTHQTFVVRFGHRKSGGPDSEPYTCVRPPVLRPPIVRKVQWLNRKTQQKNEFGRRSLRRTSVAGFLSRRLLRATRRTTDIHDTYQAACTNPVPKRTGCPVQDFVARLVEARFTPIGRFIKVSNRATEGGVL
jgi:hypothetical protein